MRIGMVGTRGVPARYGGFETAVEEIGQRLVDRGHEVTVFCRPDPGPAERLSTYLGMRLVHVPMVRSKSLETLTHTFSSAVYALAHRPLEVAFVFNAANAPLLPLLRRRGVRVAVHVDGIEWRRAKWGGGGRRYYRAAESLSVRWADALIADAGGIAQYYRDEFDASSEVISYGAPIINHSDSDRLAELGIEAERFHLVVARFEPENNVDLIVRGYRSSSATLPLVVVGAAPYADEYTATVHAAAGDDARIRFLGAVWDQQTLNQLYRHASTYVHGHSVGGTNPSLLRAIGAGAAVNAFDVVFNREVLGDTGRFFTDATTLARSLEEAESHPVRTRERGEAARTIAIERYRWDDVASAYEHLALRLRRGETRRHEVSGRRVKSP